MDDPAYFIYLNRYIEDFYCSIFTSDQRCYGGFRGGVNAFKDKDFGVTIKNDEYREFSLIIDAYNELAKILRDERMAIYQRELLLDTVIQATPVALILTNDKSHIVWLCCR